MTNVQVYIHELISYITYINEYNAPVGVGTCLKLESY